MNGFGLGAVDHSGFVTLGMTPSDTGGNQLLRDVAIGVGAFAAVALYDNKAPKKWPKPKKLWQDLVFAGGLYLLGTYVANRVI
jgi:hypothetical protein